MPIGLYVRFAGFPAGEATFVFMLGGGKLALRDVPADKKLVTALAGNAAHAKALVADGVPTVDIDRQVPFSLLADWNEQEGGISNEKAANYLNGLWPVEYAVCYGNDGEEIVLLGSLPPP